MTWVNELVQLDQNFDLKKEGIMENKFPWAPRLWVGRR